MKKLLHLLSFLPLFAFGQKTTWHEYRTDTIPHEVKVEVQDGKLIFTGRTEMDTAGFLPRLSPLSLFDGDILFNATSVSTFHKHTRDSVKILSIREKGEAIGQTPKKIIVLPLEEEKHTYQYAILDAMEDHLEYGQTYIIEIERSFHTDFDPGEPLPKLNYGWNIAAAGVGAGAIISGIILKEEGKDQQKIYERNWREGLSEMESQSFYDDAEKNIQRGNLLLAAGAAILVSDAICYWIRNKNWNNRNTLHERLKKRAANDLSLQVFPSGINAGTMAWNVGTVIKF